MKTQYDHWKEAHDQVIAEMAAESKIMRYSVHETRENQLYKHGIQVFKMLEFHAARQWMIQTYGFSDSIDNDVKLNEHWAFFLKYNHFMLYLKSDEELSWFKMKYGREVE